MWVEQFRRVPLEEHQEDEEPPSRDETRGRNDVGRQLSVPGLSLRCLPVRGGQLEPARQSAGKG